MRYHVLAAILGVTQLGCSDATSGVQKCSALVSVLCKKAFECGAGSLYTSQADCEAKQSEAINCAAWTVPAGCTQDWSRFDACLDDTADAACGTVQGGQLPPSCQTAIAVAAVPVCEGVVLCGSRSSSSSGEGCLRERRNCTDGKSYAFACEDGACVCKVDGVTTQPAMPGAGLSCETKDEAVMNQACGWKLAVTYRPTKPEPDMASPGFDFAPPPPDLIPGCVIGGTYYAPDVVAPQNPCYVCKPETTTTDWSPRDGIACGNGCGVCAAGVCGPAVLASTSRTQGIAVDSSSVYFTDTIEGKVMKVPLGGGTPVTIATGAGSAESLAVDATHAYWVGSSTGAGYVMRVPLGGGTPTTLASGGKTLRRLVLDASSVYWTDENEGTGGTVMKVALGGGTPVTLASGQASPNALAVDASSVYWTNFGSGTVMKVGLGGGTPVVLASGQGNPMGLALNASSLYWVNYTEIIRMPLGGGTPGRFLLRSNTGGVAGFVLDAASVYWLNAVGSENIEKAALSNAQPKLMVRGLATPSRLAVDASCVYWTGGSKVYKMPK